MPAGASVAERIDHLTKFEEGDVELLVASQFTCKWRPCIIYGTPQIEPGASHAQKLRATVEQGTPNLKLKTQTLRSSSQRASSLVTL